jgi:DNA-binding response OmpR family regulator
LLFLEHLKTRTVLRREDMGLIVLIEDNEHSARMAAKLLRRANHEVILAEDGETGLQTLFDSQPDLILLDLGLPDIDGQTVIGLARQQKHLASKPFIAFTAWPLERAAEMAKTYGCDGVITKPINTRTFAQQVEDFLIESKKDEPTVTDTQPEVEAIKIAPANTEAKAEASIEAKTEAVKTEKD